MTSLKFLRYRNVDGDRLINLDHVKWSEPQGPNKTLLHMTEGETHNIPLSIEELVTHALLYSVCDMTQIQALQAHEEGEPS